MHSFELTDRGKITVAVLVVIPILILSIILAVLAMAANVPEEIPDEPDASGNNETITLTPQPETPEPPNVGGFPPPYDNEYADTSTSDDPIYSDTTPDDTTTDDESAANGETDTSGPAPYGDPSLNITTGQLTFNFYLQNQSSLDRRTANLLNTFLNLPSNTQGSTIAIETPALSGDDSDHFMSVITSVLGEHNIDSRRITHIVNPELPIDERFEVVMYFITLDEK